VVVTHIPPTDGDPVQSTVDRNFYFRHGDQFSEMPYDMLRRMFSATASPDLRPIFDARIVTLNDDQTWSVPILLGNNSSAAARDVRVSINFLNPEATVSINSDVFRDVSYVNPGMRLFMHEPTGPIFRGMNTVVGTFHIAMQRSPRPKRRLDLAISLYATGMRARRWEMRINLARAGFTVRQINDDFLY
jgi:hypothetical protein